MVFREARLHSCIITRVLLFIILGVQPNHLSICATASSNGTIGLWNFAQSLEEPIMGSDGAV